MSVAHKVVHKKELLYIQILDKASSVKTICKQCSGTGIPSHVLSTVCTETALAVSPFQTAIVLEKKENFSLCVHSNGDTERGEIWYSCFLYLQESF